MDKKKKKARFLRKESSKKSRLGKRRKNKLKWRRQKGKHSKIRARMKGYLRQPSIGFGSDKKIAGKINNLDPITIYNLEDLTKVGKNHIIILAHISKKNKIEIAKKAKEKGIKIFNLNKKFLEKVEKEKANKAQNIKPTEKKIEK